MRVVPRQRTESPEVPSRQDDIWTAVIAVVLGLSLAVFVYGAYGLHLPFAD